MSRWGQPNRASIARSVSRWPPCAAGSISQAPSVDHSTLPDQRSPCSRAGGSGGPGQLREPIAHPLDHGGLGRGQVAGVAGRRQVGRDPVRGVPGCPLRRPGRCASAPDRSRRPARRSRRPGAEGRCPRRRAAPPAARPSSAAAAVGAGRSRLHVSVTSRAPSIASTAGTGGPPGTASQRSPAASAATPGPSLTTTVRPSASSTRAAPPPSGADRRTGEPSIALGGITAAP